MAIDHIENSFRLRALGKLSGRELAGKIYDLLAWEGQFERVSDLTKRLIEGGTSDVADWLAWIEPYYNDPQWIPFRLDTRNGPTEWDRKMRDNYRRVAELARAVIEGELRGQSA